LKSRLDEEVGLSFSCLPWFGSESQSFLQKPKIIAIFVISWHWCGRSSSFIAYMMVTNVLIS
jgi:hypothetical protein